MNAIDKKYCYFTSKHEAVTIPELGNIVFKAYANGNIQIKGLTKEN